MFKGFPICPSLVNNVPLNVIRCQQLVNQKTVLLKQLFKLSIGKCRLHRFTACFRHHDGILHTPFVRNKEVLVRIIKASGCQPFCQTVFYKIHRDKGEIVGNRPTSAGDPERLDLRTREVQAESVAYTISASITDLIRRIIPLGMSPGGAAGVSLRS